MNESLNLQDLVVGYLGKPEQVENDIILGPFVLPNYSMWDMLLFTPIHFKLIARKLKLHVSNEYFRPCN